MFASLSRNSEPVGDEDSANTDRVTKLAVRIFKDYLTKKNIPQPEKRIQELADVLKSFYVEARKAD